MIMDPSIQSAEPMTLDETPPPRLSGWRRLVMWLRGLDAHSLRTFNTMIAGAVVELEKRTQFLERLTDQLRGRLLAATFEIEVLQEEVTNARGPKLRAAINRRMKHALSVKIQQHNNAIDARNAKPAEPEPPAGETSA
jgi:hypothetical protein